MRLLDGKTSDRMKVRSLRRTLIHAAGLPSIFLFLFLLSFFIFLVTPRSGSQYSGDGVVHRIQVVRGGILGGPRWMVDLVDKMFFRTMNITLDAGMKIN